MAKLCKGRGVLCVFAVERSLEPGFGGDCCLDSGKCDFVTPLSLGTTSRGADPKKHLGRVRTGKVRAENSQHNSHSQTPES